MKRLRINLIWKNRFILVLAGMIGLLIACSRSDFFFEFHTFTNALWNKQESIRFEVPIRDDISLYDVLIEIRNNNQYPFRNIRLFIDCRTSADIIWTDTLHANLADIYGKWYGQGMSLYTCTLPYKINARYPNTGVYIYTIRQGMCEDKLKGISDIGLKIVKHVVQ